MRYLFTLIWILIIGDSFSQKLFAEIAYKDSDYGFGATQIIPLSNGSLFLSQSNITTSKKNTNQILAIINKDGTKSLEFNTQSKDDLKGLTFEFIYSNETGNLYGLGFDRKGINGNKSTVSIIQIKPDGSYKLKNEVPTSKHVCSFFIFNNDLVILSLDNENKRDINDGSDGIPSGNFYATIIKEDLSSITEKQLTIPSFKAETGYSKYKLIGSEANELFFVTEVRYMTKDEKIGVIYQFLKYDLVRN
jgi:hypothetical protein